MLGFPRSLREDYPNLKQKLLHLAWLDEQQKLHATKVAEFKKRMAASPSPYQVPFIMEEIKKNCHMSTFFKKEVRKMSSGELYREMREVEDGNCVGILCQEISDIKCIWVLRTFGPYTKDVLYIPSNHQTDAAIIATAQEFDIPCKELRTSEYTQEELHEAIAVDEEILREKRRISPDQWIFKKSS